MKQGKTAATSADIPTVCISRAKEPCHKEARGLRPGASPWVGQDGLGVTGGDRDSDFSLLISHRLNSENQNSER